MLGLRPNFYDKGVNLAYKTTLPKANMDTQNNGLEKVTPLKNGIVLYLR